MSIPGDLVTLVLAPSFRGGMDWEQAKGPVMLMGEIILLPCSRTTMEVEEKVVVRHSYSSNEDVGDGNTMEGNLVATVEAPFLCRQGVKRRGRLIHHLRQPM